MLINQNDPLLHRQSSKVTEADLADQCKLLKPIISIMFAELYRYDALGISACQLGFDKSLFIMSVEGEERVCINPEMIAANLTMSLGKEGCLSFRGLSLNVQRPIAVAVRYHNHDGVEITEKLEGMKARVFLHEFDHLQGICFTDRVGKLKLDMAKKKQAKRLQGVNK
jgi:peptide deformylase